MALKQTFTNTVDDLFNSLGDLVDTFVLTQKTSTSFDYITNKPITTTPVTTTIKGLVIREFQNTETNSINLEVNFKNSDLNNTLGIYDTANLNGQVWKILSYTQDAVLTIATLGKGK